MANASSRFLPFAERMRSEGLPDLFIDTFANYYDQLARGETGLIPESGIEPVGNLPDLECLDVRFRKVGEAALPRTVVIKLNGGLGTSMGLARAKSLLVARDGLTFLDIIARQALDAGLSLVLMNSFATDSDSLKALERYPELSGRLSRSFLQHKAPKITQEDLSPVSWPQDPALEWCPPGHGDLYVALKASGLLDEMLEAGFRYAFVSNSDNLGAVLDAAVLGYLVDEQIPFLMEVADRTEMDKKGGHLARRPNGGLLLRESAQCPSPDRDAFQDVARHRYFNTNSLWLDLSQLEQTLKAKGGNLGLPMIRNAKTVDPRDSDSTPVYQLETAMAAAISVFEGARALRVPRSRFTPVKTTNELLALRSDAYLLTDDYHLVPNPDRKVGSLLVSLDSAYFKMLADFEARFPHGAPSLVDCERLEVIGDWTFGRDVVVKGNVRLVNESGEPRTVPDGSILDRS
jgi:UTP--glucose-1-phosphate uridylyltransferase